MLDKALALADYDGFKQRRREAAQARQVSRPRHFLHARACRRLSARRRPRLSFPGGEKLVLGLNVQSTGQGHATVFTPMLAERLGIRPEQIEHRHGDSAMEIAGYASVGSRSAMTVGRAIDQDRRGDARERQGDRRGRARSRGSRHRISRRAFRAWSAPIAASRCSISPRAPRR